jgi:3-methyladenine DNA glycosylase AlkD
MKKTALSILFAAALAAADKPQTFTGVITDTMCKLDHKHMNMGPDAECVRGCVKSSQEYKYALHNGRKMYVLSDQQTPEKFAAQRVKITGTLYPKTGIIKVEKIEAAK